jgi:hypothetical protein
MTMRIVLAALLAALFLPSALARADMRGSLVVTFPF